MRLSNRVSIVTGGSSGIGRATAELFAREGSKVTLVDIDYRGGLESVGSIRRVGGDASFVKCNVADEEQVQSMVRMST